MSVNTEPQTSVQFYLVYEELLSRVSGRYQYTVNINPQLKLSSYSVGVSITEMSDITHISVNRLSYKRGPESQEATGDNHINEEEEVEGAEIMMSPTNTGKVTVNYAPNVKTLQHELRHEKHPLQVKGKSELQRTSSKILTGFGLKGRFFPDNTPSAKDSYWVTQDF